MALDGTTAASWAVGTYGPCVSLASAVIGSCNRLAAIAPTLAYSVVVLVKPLNVTTYFATQVRSSADRFSLGLITTNTLFFGHYNGSAWNGHRLTIASGTWGVLTAVHYPDSTGIMWWNGIPSAAGADPGNPGSDAAPFYMNQAALSSCDMAALMVYNRAMGVGDRDLLLNDPFAAFRQRASMSFYVPAAPPAGNRRRRVLLCGGKR